MTDQQFREYYWHCIRRRDNLRRATRAVIGGSVAMVALVGWLWGKL